MTSTAVEIDGSIGEGGGQILRSALSLALATGRSFRIRNIRASRRKPGLLQQHLTAVTAAAEIGSAKIHGARLGAKELAFQPGAVRPGSYRFSVGTAGSTTLVLQTVLPSLLLADGPSDLVIEGGTHNPFAPPFDFVDRVLLPVLARMGARVKARLDRPGFYPGGGGRLHVEIEPVACLARVDLMDRGEIVRRRAVARVSNLPRHIADRELDAVREALSWEPGWCRAEPVGDARGPGNVLIVEIASEHITELFTGFGMRGVRAERVAKGVVTDVRAYLASDAPVGPYLADQVLVPMTLAGGGSFTTVAPTRHTMTNIEIVKTFVNASVSVARETRSRWRIDLETGRP